MILVYLHRRSIPRAGRLRPSPVPDTRVVRVWDSPTRRRLLTEDPSVVGLWGPYQPHEAPASVDALDDADVIFDR